MTLFTDRLSLDFTDNELMRIMNLYTRRIVENGREFYGKRDRRSFRKIRKLLANDPDLKALYCSMDYGVGKFQKSKRLEFSELCQE